MAKLRILTGLLWILSIYAQAGCNNNAAQLRPLNRSIKPRTTLENALIQAVHNDEFDSVQNLLHQGADANTRDDNQDTLLKAAVLNRSGKIITCLLDHGANIDATDALGCSPLFMATLEDYPNIVTLLIEKGADVTVKNVGGITALEKASEPGRDKDCPHALEIAAMLKKAGSKLSDGR